MATEEHKQAYRDAWREYRWMELTLTDERRLELQNIMDAAQNNFTFAEFQEFKVTLPGFVEWWAKLMERAKDDHLQRGQSGIPEKDQTS